MSRLMAAAAVVIASAGCGGGDIGTPKATEQDHVSGALISALEDRKDSVRNLAGMFVAGSAPAAVELKKYAKYSFVPAGPAVIDGGTASVKVRVLDAKTDQEVGRADWTLQKEGVEWKLKSAPLPAGK